MDDPGLDPREHQRALVGLSRVHVITRLVPRLWQAMRKALLAAGVKHARVVDVGCGSGYLLLKLNALAKRDGFELELVGCDFSKRALAMAQENAQQAGAKIETFEVDVLSGVDLPHGDVVMCSLFLHHFENGDVVRVLGKLRQAAQRLVLVEDLLRSRLGYCLCWLGVHTLTRSPIVRTDGLLSVRAGFQMAEMEQMLNDAGYDPQRLESALKRHWPERLLLEWAA